MCPDTGQVHGRMLRPIGRVLWVVLVRHAVMAMALLSLATYVATYAKNCFGPPLRDDAVGYFSYLPSYLIYQDASMEKWGQARFGGEIPAWTGLVRYPPTGRYINKYTIGLSVMALPFFVAGDLAAIASGSPRDGWSFPYQHALGLAGLFYMLLGIWLLRRFLLGFFSAGVTAATLWALLLGTNLLAYGAGISTISHAYSFCLFAALLVLTKAWHARPESAGLSILLGLVAGLIPLVRVPNALVLMVVPIYGVERWADVGPRLRLYAARWRSVLLAAAVAAAVFVPQLLVWRYSSGFFLANTYRLMSAQYGRFGFEFDFAHPHLFAVLFSLQRGLFVWSPLLLLCVAGLFPLRRRAPGLLRPTLLFMAANLYVVSSWVMWWYGGSFGHRAFVESYAVMALPLASLYASLKPGPWKRVVVVFSVVAVAYSLVLMEAYWSGEIPWEDGLDVPTLRAIATGRLADIRSIVTRVVSP